MHALGFSNSCLNKWVFNDFIYHGLEVLPSILYSYVALSNHIGPCCGYFPNLGTLLFL